ncbi:putative E3 ubiquitin-protein ligase [Apophysomyces ossiformis]|uniref:HECT-type E3 ubiquitin transferase n=1 Tax=Apophysomyces ossiformis TaxID=679940 RepID=A0A8H7ETB8_9FUNG|nr:putative E3 ubiquitin-protein ligase [Apophysomyces ossiformis]
MENSRLLYVDDPRLSRPASAEPATLTEMEEPAEMPVNVIRSMMTATDRLLKRPATPLRRMRDIRFLLIILENPLVAQHNFPAETKYHHNLLKRVFGMLSNLNNECHQGLVNWFAKYDTNEFSGKVDLVHTFLSHRIAHAQRAKVGLPAAYESDWKMASAARVMALLFAANQQVNKIPISDFYNTMVDCIELMKDFASWQSRSGKFAFCQYPFLITMGSKMQIMESDAKQQMETKWREAFFSMLFHQKVSMPYLVLRVRRENLIEDSLRQLAQNELDLKKSLRIEFIGEDGVDAGGLRKEWFLLLVRSLFDPQYGMFTYDEDSNLCWFNAASFENEDQFFLVGVVLGLAIYNSTILDIHLPIACYKKLLNHPVGLADLGVFRPALMHGFNQLLTFEGDVESVFCRSFVAEIDTFGQRRCVPLMENGATTMVNNENRKEFVKLYVDYVLNKSVERQFGAFKRGFYHVCGGNALSLFRPEEIELLIRGSDGPLEIDDLKSQTEYQGFDENEETIVNFWSIMKDMAPEMQRRLLMFVTGSDRIPATGAANMSLKIACGYRRLIRASTNWYYTDTKASQNWKKCSEWPLSKAKASM